MVPSGADLSFRLELPVCKEVKTRIRIGVSFDKVLLDMLLLHVQSAAHLKWQSLVGNIEIVYGNRKSAGRDIDGEGVPERR